MSNGWGVLVAKCDKSRSAKHLDRSVDRSGDVTSEPFREQPDIELRLTKTIVGRMLMNAEGTSRAQTQVADILIDMPSGASSMLRPRTSRPGPRSPVQKMAPPNTYPRSNNPGARLPFLTTRFPRSAPSVSAKHCVITCDEPEGSDTYVITVTDHSRHLSLIHI